MGCEQKGYYAKIKEVIYGAKFYEDLEDLAVVGGTLSVNDSVVVKGIKKNSVKTIDPANITYTVEPLEGAVINATTGEIESVAQNCTLTVTLKDGESEISEPYKSLSGIAKIITE